MSQRKQDRAIGALIPVTILGILVVALVLAFWISTLSVNDARILAFFFIVLLLPATLGAFFLGRLEARGQIAGMDQGIERVMDAAGKTAAIRVHTSRSIRQPVGYPQPTIIELPQEPPWSDGPLQLTSETKEL